MTVAVGRPPRSTPRGHGRLTYWAWLAVAVTPIGILSSIAFAFWFEDTVGQGHGTTPWQATFETIGVAACCLAGPIAGEVLAQRARDGGNGSGSATLRRSIAALVALALIVIALYLTNVW